MDTSRYVLERDDGQRFDLTPPGSVYLTNVAGLGAVSSNTFAPLGGGFYVRTYTEQPQDPIQGDVVYREGAFNSFKALADFIFSAKTLYFCYTPLGTEYRKTVTLKTLEKSKRDRAGYMKARVVFEPSTQWLLPTPTPTGMQVTEGTQIEFTEHSGEFYFTFTDDLVFGPELGEYTTMIPATGHDPAGIILRYHGEIKDPIFELTGAGGTVYGRCVIDGTFAAGDTIELSTVQRDCHVHKITAGVVTDLVLAGKVDLAYEPYFTAPPFEASVLTIDGDGEFSGSTELQVFSQWRTV